MFLQEGRHGAPKMLTRLFLAVLTSFVLLVTGATGASAERGDGYDRRSDRRESEREWRQSDEDLPAPEVEMIDHGDGTGVLTVDPSQVNTDSIPGGVQLQVQVFQSDAPTGRFRTPYYSNDSEEVNYGDEKVVIELNDDEQPYAEPTYYKVVIDAVRRGDVIRTFEDYPVYELEGQPSAPPVPPTISTDFTGDKETASFVVDNSGEPYRPLFFEVWVDDARVDVGGAEVAPGDVFEGNVDVPFGSNFIVVSGYTPDAMTYRYEERRPQSEVPTPPPTQQPAPTTAQPSPTTITASPQPSATSGEIVPPSPQPSPSATPDATATAETEQATAKRNMTIFGFIMLFIISLAILALVMAFRRHKKNVFPGDEES